jgi:hypothetical protein
MIAFEEDLESGVGPVPDPSHHSSGLVSKMEL